VASEAAVAKALRTLHVMDASGTQRSLLRGLRAWQAFSAAAALAALRRKHEASLGASVAAASAFLDAQRLTGKVFRAWASLRDPLRESAAARCAKLLHASTLPRLLRAKVRALSVWRGFVRRVDEAKAAAECRRAAVSRVAGSRLSNRLVATAFHTWCAEAVHRKRVLTATANALARSRAVLAKMAARHLHRGLGTWAAAVRCMAAADAAAQAALGQALRLMASRALVTLRAALRHWSRQAAAHAAAVEAKKQSDRQLRRVLNRLTVAAPLQEAVHVWHERVRASAEAERYVGAHSHTAFLEPTSVPLLPCSILTSLRVIRASCAGGGG